MWLHHFFSFIGTVASYFFDAIGTTFLAIILGVVFATATTLATLRRVHKLHGGTAMKNHWRDDVKVAIRVSVVCAAVVYLPILFWKTAQAAYDDHTALVSRSRGQRSVIAGSDKRLEDVKVEDLAKYTDLRVSCAGIQGSNGQLQNQNRDQQNSINSCQSEAIKRMAPEPSRLFVHDVELMQEPGTRALIFTSNKTITPAVIVLRCEEPVKNVQMAPLGVHQMQGGLPQLIAPNTWVSVINEPAWSEEFPILIQYVPIKLGTDPRCLVNRG